MVNEIRRARRQIRLEMLKSVYPITHSDYSHPFAHRERPSFTMPFLQ